MASRAEDIVTALLAGGCLLAGAIALAPRVLAKPSPLVVEQPPLQVAVLGEVAEPGVYALPFGSRVSDAVAAAGGMLPTAAPDLVPQAAPLTDGQSVHVPAAMAGSGGSAGGQAAQRVSLNSATLEQLDGLPGVGPVLAERIVLNRPYAELEDVMKVPGIGPATYERLEPHVGL